MVEKMRKALDAEECLIIRRIIEEGIAQGKFKVENIELMTDIIHYTCRGLEVPYIYDRLAIGLSEEDSLPIVRNIIRRTLGYEENKQEIINNNDKITY